MKATIVKIGNSQGIRIPKRLIEQCKFGREVVLSVEDGRLIVAPKRRPREGWEAAFAACGPSDNDEKFWPDDMKNDFDDTEWRW